MEITGVSDGHGSALWTSDRCHRDEEKRSGDEGVLPRSEHQWERTGVTGLHAAWRDPLPAAWTAPPFPNLSFPVPEHLKASAYWRVMRIDELTRAKEGGRGEAF